MGLNNLLNGVQTLAIVCNQFGDTGKGKFSDYLASEWADVTARGTGGNNAGHTVVANRQERIFHLIPAGITNDKRGQTTIMGNGMVLDLSVLTKELNDLDKDGISYNNLMISKDAHVILPIHIQRDKAKHQSQKNGGIGTTGRGIGPCYADKAARGGVRIEDLFDKDKLSARLNKTAEFYSFEEFNKDAIIDELQTYTERIQPFVRNTVSEMHHYIREGKKILLEGAQGLLLSIEHGTYPFVTSSDCSINGLASGVGLSAKAIDLPLGIIKFPFMTRVGAGPFPTEIGGKNSETYCAKDGHEKRKELEDNEIPLKEKEGTVKYDNHHPKIIEMMNSDNSFTQGVGIRLAAGEYGATTGRPRRIGWTDAVSARYAVGINGPNLLLTKVDAIAGIDNFRIAHKYDNESNFSRDLDFQKSVKASYQNFNGYGNISEIRSYSKLPRSLRESIQDFEKFTRGNVRAISIGPEREATIVRG